MDTLNAAPRTAWTTRPSSELIDHIVAQYHEAMRRDVPALIEAARTVERVHADTHDVPRGLADYLEEFWLDMEEHLLKEERVLFPMLRAGACGPQVYMPVRVMEHEHDEHAAALARIRELTSDLQLPPHACATWTALYQGLRTMETELLEHIHLENTVLFPRAGGDR